MPQLSLSLFRGRHFDCAIIILCIRWYITYKLSYRDLSETKVWTSKYLNNLIEQDHRKVKQRIYPMLGFKNFRNVAVTISGIELVQKIKKGQFDIAKFTNGVNVRVRKMWEAVLVV